MCFYLLHDAFTSAMKLHKDCAFCENSGSSGRDDNSQPDGEVFLLLILYYNRKCVHTKKTHRFDRSFQKCGDCSVKMAISNITKCALEQHGNREVTWKVRETFEKTEESGAKKKKGGDDAYGEQQRVPKETKRITKDWNFFNVCRTV